MSGNLTIRAINIRLRRCNKVDHVINILRDKTSDSIFGKYALIEQPVRHSPDVIGFGHVSFSLNWACHLDGDPALIYD